MKLHMFLLSLYLQLNICFCFQRETWEKKPILVQRKNPNYYKGLFSTAEFDRILRQVRIWNISMHSSLCVCVSVFYLQDKGLSCWTICMWLKDDVQYGVNLDVTSYTAGKRETHNPPGRALPFTVWDFFKVWQKWCSDRLRIKHLIAFCISIFIYIYLLAQCFHRRLITFTVISVSQSGCSLRMLNPQAFSSTVWNVLSILQEQFGSMAGANV